MVMRGDWMNTNDFGKKVKEARKEQGLTCEELASRVGLSKSAISRIENGIVQNPKLAIIESIAKSLKVNPAWIIGKEDVKYLDSKNIFHTLNDILMFNASNYYSNGDRLLNENEKKVIDLAINMILSSVEKP